jgi:hypothetical protein
MAMAKPARDSRFAPAALDPEPRKVPRRMEIPDADFPDRENK